MSSIYRYIVLMSLLYVIISGLNHILTGLMVPGNYYVEWMHDNMDYVTHLRVFLLNTSKFFLGLIGYGTHVSDYYLLRENGGGIHIVYSCIGIGLLIFWASFVLAFPIRQMNRLLYVIIGWLSIIFLNIIRISLLVIYTGRVKAIDHHSIFNLIVYILMLMGIIWIINREIPVNVENKKK